MIRSLAESTLRSLTFRRRLPAKFGRSLIHVSPSCGLRYLRFDIGKVDPTLFRLAEKYVRPGSVVWDVGANAGLFTFASAAMAGPAGAVVAFEPDTELVSLLRRSCLAQPKTAAPVTVFPVACGKDLEPRTFHLARRSRSTNHLDGYGSSETGGIRSTQTVMAISLDWAAARFRRPEILKIDVEGAEMEVLRGSQQLLESVRPIIICEVSESNAMEVAGLPLCANDR